MIKSQIPPFATTLNVAGHVADKTKVTGALETDEIKQTDTASDEKSELDESLNEAASNEEENDELEEEARVEVAAQANRD